MVQWDNRTDNLATGNSWRAYLEDDQTWSFRGSKSRNKVSVGEPAEGSLLVLPLTHLCVGELTWHARSGSLLSQIELYLKLLGHWAIVCFNFICHTTVKLNCLISNSGWKMKNYWKILSGGSLGSYVDEGRSKMREIVWIAGHIEHRYSERKLQSKARLCSTPVWGSLLNHSNLRIGKYECVNVCSLALVATGWSVVVDSRLRTTFSSSV